MRIHVKLVGWMRQYLTAGIEHFHEQHFDGDHVKDEALDGAVLHDGDEVVFVPPLKGG